VDDGEGERAAEAGGEGVVPALDVAFGAPVGDGLGRAGLPDDAGQAVAGRDAPREDPLVVFLVLRARRPPRDEAAEPLAPAVGGPDGPEAPAQGGAEGLEDRRRGRRQPVRGAEGLDDPLVGLEPLAQAARRGGASPEQSSEKGRRRALRRYLPRILRRARPGGTPVRHRPPRGSPPCRYPPPHGRPRPHQGRGHRLRPPFLFSLLLRLSLISERRRGYRPPYLPRSGSRTRPLPRPNRARGRELAQEAGIVPLRFSQAGTSYPVPAVSEATDRAPSPTRSGARAGARARGGDRSLPTRVRQTRPDAWLLSREGRVCAARAPPARQSSPHERPSSIHR
jgi:hypothetical protein